MRYIVVGASAAGISGAKTLRELDKDAEIILVSKDENVYSRCILHHYISGHRDIEALDFTDRDFFEKYNIEWKNGLEVKSIDDREHVIVLSNGESLKYDKILLATGASAFIPPVENLREAKNVVGLRNLEDAIKIKEEAEKVKNVVVLGAGLVGIDAIAGLVGKNLNVTLVEMGDRVLPIQLDKYASSKYEKRFEDAGIKLKLGVRAEKVLIDENKNPKALLINTGEEIPCELIIVATGVRSNVAFLKDSSIETDRFGLIINEKGETNSRDVYGAGDITGRNPIWPTAVKEGIIAANNMVGNEIFMEDFFGSKNTMNFLGLTTMSLGVVNVPDDSYTEEIDISGENYKKIIHKDGKIYGAIIQGDLSYAGVLTQLIKEKIHVSKVKKPLFEIDYADFFNIKENLEYTY
ncbi:NAD(P)/FAD-dependent oxidoreductase [Clostridium perfringens]|uniref:NAD(P)/FAD-dependent oxidoreductase n=2 Tax=Clostridium perfringens TaxID=1502 RepID=A0AAW9HPS7_CLOPF|nr:FAD-dependent oxidoreductase [Clostridium perfringens]MBI5993340.1 NAD(P)/FAD-dependent oxidoreductase [Clostridium perfringens]MBI6069912.1 NAD(P)/FAD-dependent oxidoreductase [Clostridium perfringens]MBI6072660.1 NAD(P)/FAD-dependent oxidoreductase [Clostridium perfringens]MBI6086600.1 NAD(P)/FAD-dependent oxidoreductase [Clostridium perfringens]MBI6092044.1 NAD(P)/FAD-dependent oxidoreductase [Clostridium perfringens]